MSTSIEAAIKAVVQPVPDAVPDESGLPYVTHSGVLELAPGLRVKVYVLSDGRPIIDEEGFAAFLRWLGHDQEPAHG